MSKLETNVVLSPDKETQSSEVTAVGIEVIDERCIPVEKVQNSEVATSGDVEISYQEDLTQCSQSQSILANNSQSEFGPPEPVREHPSRKEKSSRRASHSRSRSKERPGRDVSDERCRGLRHRQSPSPSLAKHSRLPQQSLSVPPKKGKK